MKEARIDKVTLVLDVWDGDFGGRRVIRFDVDRPPADGELVRIVREEWQAWYDRGLAASLNESTDSIGGIF